MQSLYGGLLWDPQSHIQTGSPIANNSIARAAHGAHADDLQARMMWGGWPHYCSVGEIPSGASASVSRPVYVVVPPWADKARVFAFAAGDGTVSVDVNNVTVTGDSGQTDAVYATEWDLGEIPMPHAIDTSVSSATTFDCWCSTDVRCYALYFAFFRSTLSLS